MTREEAIERLKAGEPFSEIYDSSWNEALDMAIKALEQEPKWIPVTERLPKPFEHVLRTVKSIGWNGTSYIDVDLGTICPIDTDVIAWRPLPEPYKAESEDKE